MDADLSQQSLKFFVWHRRQSAVELTDNLRKIFYKLARSHYDKKMRGEEMRVLRVLSATMLSLGAAASHAQIATGNYTSKPSASLPPALTGQQYSAARERLLASGWEPYRARDADRCESGDERCQGRPEMQSCSGSGRASCRFLWRKNGVVATLTTAGEVRPTVVAVEEDSGPVAPAPAAQPLPAANPHVGVQSAGVTSKAQQKQTGSERAMSDEIAVGGQPITQFKSAGWTCETEGGRTEHRFNSDGTYLTKYQGYNNSRMYFTGRFQLQGNRLLLTKTASKIEQLPQGVLGLSAQWTRGQVQENPLRSTRYLQEIMLETLGDKIRMRTVAYANPDGRNRMVKEEIQLCKADPTVTVFLEGARRAIPREMLD
ncbi:hypothetical protein J2W39_005825 [Variovorax paradoxus]|uniref:Uncharacterized protein n=1 Tax=Variovorax paradoxus TaxID=34073 RepID=A0AAW8ERV1_VARPD|nr:hypothetical protein [Variovorax paradoxus]MDP9974556.1 hypothetical protein [Variovorax paradoxus]